MIIQTITLKATRHGQYVQCFVILGPCHLRRILSHFPTTAGQEEGPRLAVLAGGGGEKGLSDEIRDQR